MLIFISTNRESYMFRALKNIGCFGLAALFVWVVSLSSLHAYSEKSHESSHSRQVQSSVQPIEHLHGYQTLDCFSSQLDVTNVMSWKAPKTGPVPVSYNVYADAELSQLLASVSSHDTLTYKAHHLEKHATYSYYIVSMDSLGNRSSAVGIVFNGSKTHIVKPEAISLTLEPSFKDIDIGEKVLYTSMVTYSDGSTEDVTSYTTWNSSDRKIATIDSRGQAIGKKEGSVQITGTYQNISAQSTLTVRVLSSLTLVPSSATLATGLQQPFSVIAIYSDGSSADVTHQATWTSSNERVATVRKGEGHKELATAKQPGKTIIKATYCGKKGESRLTVNEATISSITVIPYSVTLSLGLQQSFTAIATYSDGTTGDVTKTVTWTSEDKQIANVKGEKATAKQSGMTSITASLGRKTGSGTLIVTEPKISEILITPGSVMLAPGLQQSFKATARYNDGTTADVTQSATWKCSDNHIATVSRSDVKGIVTAKHSGHTTLSATVCGQRGTASLTVSEATISQITLFPSSVTLLNGVQQSFSATATYSDGTVGDITSSVTWKTRDQRVATVCDGLVTGHYRGTTTLIASFGGIKGRSTITVPEATMTEITLIPDSMSIYIGMQRNFVAQAKYSDGSYIDVTQSAIWSSNQGVVSSVNTGIVSAQNSGSATITATIGSVSGQAALTVLEPKITSIVLFPNTQTLSVGQQTQLSATATYSDGTINYVQTAIWSSERKNVASVTSTDLSKGLVIPNSPGSTLITATLAGIIGHSSISVSDITVTEILVAPTSIDLIAGLQQPFQATAKYSDGSFLDVTQQAIWSSDNDVVASVDNTLIPGNATANNGGTATLSATLSGVSGQATLTVQGPTVEKGALAKATGKFVSIAIWGANGVLPGWSGSLTAMAAYDDGSGKLSLIDVSSMVRWASSNPSILTVGPNGAAQAKGKGDAYVVAYLPGLSSFTKITVKDMTLTGLTVFPSSVNMFLTSAILLQAVATYSDGSQNYVCDVTDNANFSSNGAQILINKNRVTATSSGSITASFNGKGAACQINLILTTVNNIQINAPQSINKGVSIPVNAFAVTGSGNFLLPNFSTPWTVGTSSITNQWKSSVLNVLSNTIDSNTLEKIKGENQGSANLSFTYGDVSATQAITVSDAIVTDIQINPAEITLYKGQTIDLSSTFIFSDGSQSTGLRLFLTSGDPTIAQISLTLKDTLAAQFTVTGIKKGSTVIYGSYNGTLYSAKVTVTDPVITGISITPSTSTMSAGMQEQLRVIATYSDGSNLEVTNSATWKSSDDALISVDKKGLATVQNAGKNQAITITATVNGQQATTSVTIKSATISSIAVSPNPKTLYLGEKQQLTAIATYSDGSTEDVTQSANWSLATSKVIVGNDVGTKGLVTAQGSITEATITASLSGINGTATITVPAAKLLSIDVTPTSTVNLYLGGQQQFHAMAHYAGGIDIDATQSVTWIVNTGSVATVTTSGGLVTAIGKGTTTLNAKIGDVSKLTTIKVNSSALQSIAISPPSANLKVGEKQSFTATATYSDNNTADITQSAIWSSLNNSAATVSDVLGTKGIATANNPGQTTTITARFGSTSATATLNVSDVTLMSISLNTTAKELLKGDTYQLIATALYSNGNTEVITDSVIWTSGDPSVATVDAAGLITAMNTGTAVITATTLSGKTATATVTVTENVVMTSLTLSPPSASIAKGLTQQFVATAHYSDGTSTIIDSISATWKSSNYQVASVVYGTAAALSRGTTNITATYQGFDSAPSVLTVLDPIVMSVVLIPSDSQTILVGGTQPYSAMANYSDGTFADVTQQTACTWNSSNQNVASVSAGLATGLASGFSNISATYQGMSSSPSVLTVLEPVLLGINLDPFGAQHVSLSGTNTQPYRAMANYEGGSQVDVTLSATWNSSDQNVASVVDGLATGIAQGFSIISATYQGYEDQSRLTVDP